MNQSKKMTDGALLIAIFIILMLIAMFVPVITVLAMLLLPIPFVLYAYKYDWKPSMIMLLAAITLSSLFAIVITLPLTLLVGIGGIMIGTAIHRKLHAYEVWSRGTLGFILGLLFIYVFSQLVLQVNWATEIDLMLSESMEMSQELLEQFGVADQTDEELSLVEERLSELKNLLPVGLALVAIFLSFITQWLSYKVINRLEQKHFKFPPFRTLRLPVALVWIYFIALLFTFFDFDTNSVLHLGVQNVHVLVGLFMTLQGFSFIFFYAHHKQKSNILPVISVIITLLLPFVFLYLIRIIGIIDIGFSLRDRITSEKK